MPLVHTLLHAAALAGVLALLALQLLTDERGSARQNLRQRGRVQPLHLNPLVCVNEHLVVLTAAARPDLMELVGAHDQWRLDGRGRGHFTAEGAVPALVELLVLV